jgi:MarR family transcriptional regulator, organic hydroperoxide resistance regulator
MGDTPGKQDALDAGHLHYTDRLSFPIHQLSAQLARVVNPLFREFDIDLNSSRVLVLALERGGLGAGEMVDLLLLPQSTVSHMLQRLERIGYIERRRTGSDQRVVTIQLTERGRTVAQACNQRSIEVFDAMVAPLAPSQIAECRKAMDLMLIALAQLR